MTAMISDAKPVAPANTIHQRVAQAWQDNPVGKSSTMEKKESASTPQLSAEEQSGIDDFIEGLRTTEDKRGLFGLLNKKLMSLSKSERIKFVTGLETTLETSTVPGDETLLKEKYNPAYAMYIANDMLLGQLKEQVFSQMGKIPNEDDEEQDEI
ncbi:TPA: hypothetical protein U5D21_000831 [Yersinia enterocolitica]|nr:hypothetical protein [Yersinia enterocolitica]